MEKLSWIIFRYTFFWKGSSRNHGVSV